MSNTDGTLSTEEHARALAWLNEKTKNFACPVCNTNEWGLGQHFVEDNIYRGGNLIVGGPVYPLIFVSCMNCAYTRHFNAIQMGVIKNEEPKKNPDTAVEPQKASGGNVG